MRYGGFRATALYRAGHWAHRNRIPLIPSLTRELNHALHSIELTPHTPIGPGLYMPHTVGTVITAERIGANCEFQGGITIGQRTGNGFPTLGDGVVVSCGARILGKTVLGNGATVGANAVVIRNVPAGALAVGVPARVICKEGRSRHTTAAQSAIDQSSLESIRLLSREVQP
jgi:serine O-acetyltransferase